jgi:hypothetical protein
MKRIRLNKLIISHPFVACAANVRHASCSFSHHLHSFLSTDISESIYVNSMDADVIYIRRILNHSTAK